MHHSQNLRGKLHEENIIQQVNNNKSPAKNTNKIAKKGHHLRITKHSVKHLPFKADQCQRELLLRFK